jgi:hypothetical protein
MRPIIKFDPQFENVPHPWNLLYLKAWGKWYHEPKHTYYVTTMEVKAFPKIRGPK